MKSVFVVLFMAGFLPMCNLVRCPSGVLLSNGTLPNQTKDCSSCVEYRCSSDGAVQYGCPGDALQDCPAFSPNVSSDPDSTAYCKEANGSLLYYFPACKNFTDFSACNETKDLALNFSSFMGKCNTLEHGQDLVVPSMMIKTQCPRTGGGAVFCQACAAYECKSKKGGKISGSGCVEHFYEDCSGNAKEINFIKAHTPSRMYYCNENVELFWSGCQGEADWATCMAQGKKMNKTLEEEAAMCKNRTRGQVLWGPQEITTTTTPLEISTSASNSSKLKNFTKPAAATNPGCFHHSSVLAERTPCEVCVYYTCNKFVKSVKQQWMAIGCLEDFYKDCATFRQEIAEIKKKGPSEPMYFCNNNLQFYSGCDGEGGSCIASGSHQARVIIAEMNNCKNLKPGEKRHGREKKLKSSSTRTTTSSLFLVAALFLLML